MMRKMVVFSVALILSFVFCSVSEALNLNKGIIGKWIEVKNDGRYGEQIEFLKDGTVIVRSVAGDYKFIDDNRLKMVLGPLGAKVFEVSIDKQGQLILTDPAGKVVKYITKAELGRRMAIQRAEEKKRLAEGEKRLKLIKLRFKDNGDGTVTDSQTGLMWTKKINPMLFTYSFDWATKGIALMNGKVEYGMPTHKDDGTPTHPNFGYKDWRLPSNEELGGILTTLSKYYSYKNFQDFIPFTNVNDLVSDSLLNCYYTKSGALDWRGRGTDVFSVTVHCKIWPVRAGVASSSAPSKLPPPTPPTMPSTSPANNATGVATNTGVTATFSEAMDASTITTATFTIAGITGTVTYSGTTATFTPSSNLAYNTTYTATITTGVRDTSGNAMASNYSWNFTTRE